MDAGETKGALSLIKEAYGELSKNMQALVIMVGVMLALSAVCIAIVVGFKLLGDGMLLVIIGGSIWAAIRGFLEDDI